MKSIKVDRQLFIYSDMANTLDDCLSTTSDRPIAIMLNRHSYAVIEFLYNMDISVSTDPNNQLCPCVSFDKKNNRLYYKGIPVSYYNDEDNRQYTFYVLEDYADLLEFTL